MTAPTKDEFYAIAFDDVDANLSHEECEEWAEFMTAPTKPPSLTVAAAYNPSDRGNSAGGEHLVLSADYSHGRLHRRKGDALCKPFAKFWGLTPEHGRRPSCKRCIDIAARHGLALSLTTGQARDFASKWAEWKAWADVRGGLGQYDAEYEGPWDPHGEEGSERARLESWVRARMRRWAPGEALALHLPESRADFAATLEGCLSEKKGRRTGDAMFGFDNAWALCEQAGWPS